MRDWGLGSKNASRKAKALQGNGTATASRPISGRADDDAGRGTGNGAGPWCCQIRFALSVSSARWSFW